MVILQTHVPQISAGVNEGLCRGSRMHRPWSQNPEYIIIFVCLLWSQQATNDGPIAMAVHIRSHNPYQHYSPYIDGSK